MMGPFEAVVSVFTKPITISGRASRAEYWWFVLFCTLVSFAVIAFDVARVLNNPSLARTIDIEGDLTGAFAFASVWWTILTVPPYISVAVRRLHDIGLSGLMVFIPFVPVIGSIVFFVLMVWPGQSVNNQYGPPWSRFGGSSGGSDALYPFQRTYSPEERADMEACRKAEIRALYEERVLGKAS